MNRKIIATVEARMTSSRLPGKVLMKYGEKSNLEHIIDRLRKSNNVDEIVIATTTNSDDDPIVELCKSIQCKFYRGSENDVLLRVLEAAKSASGTHIVEITGDCPIVDWRVIDRIVDEFFLGDYDYVSNIIERTYPRGMDVQMFPVEILEKVNQLTKSPVDHEHVSLYIYTHPELFRLKNIKAPAELNYPEYEITLDTKEDYTLILELYEKLYSVDSDFSSEMVIELLKDDSTLHEKALESKRKDPFKEQKEWVQKNEKV